MGYAIALMHEILSAFMIMESGLPVVRDMT
jgi:hypothetical protein